MLARGRGWHLWVPMVVVMIIHGCTYFPEVLEVVYVGRIYPAIGWLLRSITGSVPFSLGDLLYAGLLGSMILSILRWMFRKRRIPGAGRRSGGWYLRAVQWCWGLCGVYVIFQICWGFNYGRNELAASLGLKGHPGDSARLQVLARDLLTQTNRFAGQSDRMPDWTFDRMVTGAVQGFAVLTRSSSMPALGPVSVKRSLYGSLGNYLGYSGYYNPFTGEAQVNDAVPRVLHPFVICHEMAHQLGYAREQEANLAGFLAARASSDSALRYSAYFDMFLYANGALYAFDSVAARSHLQALAPPARRDLETLRTFRIRYRNPVEEVINVFYDRYLKMNGQSEGTRSYGIVVHWLLALHRRDGGI